MKSKQTRQDRARQLLEMEIVDRVSCLQTAYTLKEGIEALQFMPQSLQEETLNAMSTSHKAEYTQSTMWQMAKSEIVHGTQKELLGKDVDEHILNIMDSVNRDVGGVGLSEDTMSKEQQHRQVLMERKRVTIRVKVRGP